MSKKYIEIINILSVRGPGMWAYQPLIEAWVDIGDLEDCPSNTIPGLYERLVSWLPTLIEHRCSVGERGGFLQRLRDGTWPAHIMEHVALELQSLAGMPDGMGRARETSVRSLYKLVISAPYEPVARAALYAARDLVMAAIEDRPFNLHDAINDLRDLGSTLRLGPSTESIVRAAEERKIPMIRLSESHNLVQFGYGAAQRRIWTAETDRTGAIAEGIASNKDLTKRLLQNCGVPVPEGHEVYSATEAWEAACELGTPVVVKPTDGNHGRGVFTNLTEQQEIETAYGVAIEEGSGVVVERFIPGEEHRVLVVGNRMVAASRGEVASVTGDGEHTIRELIELQINSDPRRGSEEENPLNFITLDSTARLEISRQGFEPDAIPPQGKQVLIQRNGNVSIDVTDDVHPSVAATAVLAARIVGLDIAGLDIVTSDIRRPLQEQGGAIVEVNAGPGLLMHLKPSAGTPRPVGEAIVDHLFPGTCQGQIPLVGITGSRGKTAVAQLVGHMLRLSGQFAGLACSQGLYFDQRHVETGDAANWAQARRVLLNRAVQAGVIENGARSIVTEGLAYERCSVGVVTNMLPEDTLPDLYLDDLEYMTRVYRTQVDVVLPTGYAVLNADDEAVAALAPLCDGAIVYFGTDPQRPVVLAHREAGGRAVLVRDGWILLTEGSEQFALSELSQIPCTDNGRSPENIMNVLAAIAAGWSLGLDSDVVRAGVQTFGVVALEPSPADPAATL